MEGRKINNISTFTYGKYITTEKVSFRGGYEFNQGDNCLLDLGLSDTNEKNPLFLLYQTTDSPNGEGRLYELYLNSKASVLDFKFYRLILEINGNWEFFIE